MRNKLVDNYSSLDAFNPYYQKLELEQQLHNEAPNHRTEVNFPLSAWRGKLGVNHNIVEQILAQSHKFSELTAYKGDTHHFKYITRKIIWKNLIQKH